MKDSFRKFVVIGSFCGGLATVVGCQTIGIGNLHLPQEARKPVPAVVLVGGTGGSSGRYEFHGSSLLAAGYAVFETDYWPTNDPSLKAADYISDAFATLSQLRKNPAIDRDRIAIMGFSRGGGLALKAAMELWKSHYVGNDPGFAAHVAFYPFCAGASWNFGSASADDGGKSLTGAPIFILAGEADPYNENVQCPALVDQMNEEVPGIARIKMYPEAGHGFDADFGWYGSAATDSRQRVIEFLDRVMGNKL